MLLYRYKPENELKQEYQIKPTEHMTTNNRREGAI